MSPNEDELSRHNAMGRERAAIVVSIPAMETTDFSADGNQHKDSEGHMPASYAVPKPIRRKVKKFESIYDENGYVIVDIGDPQPRESNSGIVMSKNPLYCHLQQQ